MKLSGENTDALTAYLEKELQPICDADPHVLAEYVLALLGHDKSLEEHRQTLEQQLDDFLGSKTKAFVDATFRGLTDKEIMGSEANSWVAQTELVNTNSTTSKRADRHVAGHASDGSEDDDDDRNPKHRKRDEPKDTGETNTRPIESYDGSERQPKRRAPEDEYQDRRQTKQFRGGVAPRGGFAARGRGGAPFNNGMPGGFGMANAGAGPGERQANAPGTPGQATDGTPAPPCRDYEEKGYCMRGNLCPYSHGADRIVYNNAGGLPNGNIPPGVNPFAMGMGPNGMPNGPMPDMQMRGVGPDMGRFRGGRGRGRGRGGNRFNPLARVNTSLVVENIPQEFLSLDKVNEFFKKFGTLDNITVERHNSRAIVQFSSNSEASAAYNSPDPIFGNRFVKVYWQKQDTQVEAPKPALEKPVPSPVPEDPEVAAKKAAEKAERDKEREERAKKHQENLKAMLDIQKQKEALIQRQIEEQKKLMEKLSDTKNLSAEDKAALQKSLANIAQNINVSSGVSKAAAASTNTVSQDGNKNGTAAGTAAKAKLAELQEEAAKLGIDTSAFAQAGGRGRGGFAPRGRGRGTWPRGRGGTSMRLDNRTTKLLVKNVSEEFAPKLREQFEKFGQIERFTTEGNNAIVEYKNRWEAEEALAKGSKMADAPAPLEISWHNAPSA
ncbi:hypothetical protein BZG36_04838 [Bifiguratus adelaidae]|uniref:C3H1-type domain-containing protein n=1 Tax=Bifiguratus adelaidae TaxID=1938954 RepID=A0A261XUA1_9FUNG|nr:hypothetical protein BZG36_04838 [Bifiguratus adelaidae]